MTRSMLRAVAEVMTIEFDKMSSFDMSQAQLDMSLWAEELFYAHRVWNHFHMG